MEEQAWRGQAGRQAELVKGWAGAQTRVVGTAAAAAADACAAQQLGTGRQAVRDMAWQA